MATAKILEEHLTCSICCETYTNPHVFPCLHAFCLKCMKQLENNGQKECPQCRKPIKFSQIQPDFRIQGLVDSFNQQQTAGISREISNLSLQEKTTSPAKCQVCHDKKKSIKCKCETCDEYMCGDCEKAHKGSKASRSHKIIQNKEVIKQSRAEITSILVNLKKNKKSVSDKSSLIKKSVVKIQEAEKAQIGDIAKAIDDAITKLQNQKIKLVQEVKDGNLKITHSLKTTCERLQKHESQIKSNVDFLTDLLKSEDIGTLAEMVVSVRSSLEKDEGQIRADLEAQGEGRSPVRVVVGGDWDPGMYIRVEVDEGVVARAGTGTGGGSSKLLYSQLLGSNFHEIKHVTNDKSIVKMLIINDEIWASTYNNIQVFDRDCDKVREIKVPEITKYTGLIECEGGVAVTGPDSSGLHLLHYSGAYGCKIGAGSFADVSIYGGRLYTLECVRCRVIVYECVRGEWRQVQEFSLEYNNGDNFDRICAHSGGVLVSSCNNSRLYLYLYMNDRLYLYSDRGTLIQEAGEQGSGQPGKLNRPRLCGVDGSGTALVADWGNHRLELYTAPSTWQVVTGLPGEVRYPGAVVMENRAGHTYIWVTTRDNQLYKFKIQ